MIWDTDRLHGLCCQMPVRAEWLLQHFDKVYMKLPYGAVMFQWDWRVKLSVSLTPSSNYHNSSTVYTINAMDSEAMKKQLCACRILAQSRFSLLRWNYFNHAKSWRITVVGRAHHFCVAGDCSGIMKVDDNCWWHVFLWRNHWLYSTTWTEPLPSPV